MFKKEVNFVVASYNKFLEKKNGLDRELANTQRERDLKVDKINKKYESKIEQIIREQNANNMQIELAKRYTKEN